MERGTTVAIGERGGYVGERGAVRFTTLRGWHKRHSHAPLNVVNVFPRRSCRDAGELVMQKTQGWRVGEKRSPRSPVGCGGMTERLPEQVSREGAVDRDG